MASTPRQRLRLMLLRAFARFTRWSNAGLAKPDPAAGQPPANPRILVIRPDHIGDLLFTTPALHALRQRFPDASITVLVGPWGEPVLSCNPDVDHVLALPFPGFTKQPKPSPWQPYELLFHWARRLRGQYDLAFIQRFDHWWGALLAYLGGVPLRVGYAVPEVTPFLSHAMVYDARCHEVKKNLALIQWDMSNSDPANAITRAYSPRINPLKFFISEETMAWAKDRFGDTCPITVHPGAGAAIKLWLDDRWAAVADTLAEETEGPILLTGSKAERPLCETIAAQMKTASQVMAGETTLDQLAAILSESRLVLGLDSGPLHLAVAMGTPTVHLYGPVDTATFGPWGPPERHRVLVSDWPCIPCNQLDYRPDELADHPCVREIRVEAVLSAAREALSA